MKMAKASEADLNMAMDLTNALESLCCRWGACMPQIDRLTRDAEIERFDIDDHGQCVRVIEHLRELVNSASLMRVVFGMAVLLDPRNKMVDPTADTLEHHPETVRAKAAEAACRSAIEAYHLALDERKHGGVAAGNAVEAIETALGMPWVQGEALRRKESS